MDFCYAEEVREALRRGFPVVALESTIISHGMPYPANLQTAREVEDVVRAHGGVPATIAILSGRVHIGLSADELEILAREGQKCVKCSRRNLPVVLASKAHGATTVAATMFLAWKAGIKVFVTGGIGGVHRGAEETWDVSADLIELGRVPILVVCAGAKSILDIPKTLEFLETQGVPVLGYQTNDFPAFFVPKSGCPCMASVASAMECAEVMKKNEELGLSNGMLLGVPVPAGQEATEVEGAITQALSDMEAQRITGHRVTPFLLARVCELTGGDSLRASTFHADISLIKNNAAVGTEVAVAYTKGERLLTIGCIAQDIVCRSEGEVHLETSTAGEMNSAWGGVGRNMAVAARLSGCESVAMISVVGADAAGAEARNYLSGQGIVSSIAGCCWCQGRGKPTNCLTHSH